MSTFTLTPVRPAQDAEAVHAWLTSPHARFWEMQDHTLEQVRDYLRTVTARPEQDGWIGRRRASADAAPGDERIFYLETYRPSLLIPAHELPEQPGDLGMHLLVAPPGDAPVHGLTAAVMRDAVAFCLGDEGVGTDDATLGADGTRDPGAGDEDATGSSVRGVTGLGALRLVVEPDARNAAILAKNAAAGFRELREIDLVADGHTKRAALSVCTREDFAASPLGQGWSGERDPYAHLARGTADRAHRHLVAKALSEFAHERLITPRAEDGRAESPVPSAEPAQPAEAPAPSARSDAPVAPAPSAEAPEGTSPVRPDAVERRWVLELGETVYTFRAHITER